MPTRDLNFRTDLRYSIVIPVYNEAESLRDLHRELSDALARLGGDCEFVYVDDGSTDGTEETLAGLANSDPRVRVITFVRNFGKSAAYTAGLENAQGGVIVTLDADLQDDPAEMSKLLAALDEGYDLAVGWKQNRFGNEPVKTVPSRFFNVMVKLLFGLRLHDTNSGFRAMRRQVAMSLQLYGDQYRFIPQLAHLKGFRVTERKVYHRPRKFGRSKYGLTRFWTGFLDLVTVRFNAGFTQKPLHFFGTVGLVLLVLGFAAEVYVLVRKIMGDDFRVHMAAIVIGVLLLVVGLQLVATGLIGEMIAAQGRKGGYVIRRK